MTMRFVHVVLLGLFSAILAFACTNAESDCSKNPNLACFATGSGGSGTTGTATGGGKPSCDPAHPEQCPPGSVCQKPICTEVGCGLEALADGTKCGADGILTCKAGACAGCEKDEQCKANECQTAKCNAGTCEEAADPDATCAGGKGTCGADGVCGKCDDGVKNGDEAGVDCGAATKCGKCDGEACGAATDCKSGFCVDGVCCNAACDGKCEACTTALTGASGGEDGACGPLALGNADPDFPECDGAGCGEIAGYCACEDGLKDGDETDVDCGGGCGATCTDGLGCGADGDCANGVFCFDGVCCADYCNDQCVSCNQPGLEGLCSPLSGVDPGQCEGVEQCSVLSTCGKATGELCSADTQCATGLCKGAQKVCTECDGVVDKCPGDAPCVNKYCVPKDLNDGLACFVGASCKSGFCVDGKCCDEQCDGPCMGCNNHYTFENDGSCKPIHEGYDPHGECDGAGKASACSGQPDPMDDTKSACGTN